MRFLGMLSAMVRLFPKFVLSVGTKLKPIIQIIPNLWMWFGSVLSITKRLTVSNLIEFITKFAAIVKVVDFFSEVIEVFGFVNKFKQSVLDGFDSVHQRLVTLEAKVEALFEHTKTVAAQDEVASKDPTPVVETEVKGAEEVSSTVAGGQDAQQNP